jgi:hypothetical protein
VKEFHSAFAWSYWLPTPGNIRLTLSADRLLLLTQPSWANNGPPPAEVGVGRQRLGRHMRPLSGEAVV